MIKSRYSHKDQKVVKAWADFIGKHDWTFFCTFTTYYSLKQSGARRLMERTISILSNSLGTKVDCFWVAERHKYGDYHLHCLIKTPNSDLSTPVRKAWEKASGTSTREKCNVHSIKRYCIGMGANCYSVKQLTRKDVDYDLI